tara:strand:- start:400 stop:654 length:255 start_codon:yes stop_codon:yes gene_type:complete
VKKISLKEIISLVSKYTGITKTQITINSSAKDFRKWDSVNHIRLMLALETKTKTKISTSEMSNLDSIKKIITFLKLDLKKKNKF